MRVTVATASNHDDIGVNVYNDFNLLKPALLYADQVTLVSPTISMLMQVRQSMTEQTIPFLKPIFEHNNQMDVYNKLAKLSKKKRGKTKQEIRTLRYIEKEIGKGAKELVKSFVSMHGISADLLDALEHDGTLKIEHIPFSLSDSIRSALGNSQNEKDSGIGWSYIEIVLNSILQTGYPLFDTTTNDLFESLVAVWQHMGIAKGVIPEDNYKHIGVASHILKKLPNIDHVNIENLLGIKQELHNPLIRFRNGMESVSNHIATLPWDDNFESETEHAFITQVKPAVSEIEELCKETKWIRDILLNSNNLTRNFGFGATGGSFTGVFIGTTDFMPIIIGALLGIAYSVEPGIKKAWRDDIQRKKDARNKQMYFLYECGRRLN